MPDPRDDLAYGLKALVGLHDLMQDAGRASRQFDLAGPGELSELLGLVVERLETAAEALQSYVPRDWTPPTA